MKRKSNMFFLICAIVLLITVFSDDYQIMSTVSLAASISGIFFTLSDFFLNYGYEMKMIFDKGSKMLQDINIPCKKKRSMGESITVYVE